MEWVATAEEFCGNCGWGARGKYIGISRMFGDGDKTALTRTKMVASSRPRGLLSGFLAIVPTLGYAVYLPPIAAKMGPIRIRMRVSDELLRDGAIFSAYVQRSAVQGGPRTLVLEDVLVWKHKNVWFNTTFDERWNKIMKQFVRYELKQDTVLQGINIKLANYISLDIVDEPDDHTVLEFIPNAPNQKRLIWIPPKETVTHVAPTSTNPANSPDELTATRETSLGPDVYSVWRGGDRLGLALVRTLAVSRALRNATCAEKIPIHAIWNKQFEKWEILDTK
jgi:hypothetical protein